MMQGGRGAGEQDAASVYGLWGQDMLSSEEK